MNIALVWFRNDLRIKDHEPLFRAAKTGCPIVPFFCFDTRQFEKTSFGFPKTGPHRTRFLQESVQDLRQALQGIGSNLIVRHGKTEDVLQTLVQKYSITDIYYHSEIGSEEQQLEKNIQKNCKGIRFHAFWGHNLIHPDDLPYSIHQLPDVFTQFRIQMEQRLIIRPPFDPPTKIVSLPFEDFGEIPSFETLGVQKPPIHSVMKGGLQRGHERLMYYFFESDQLKRYKETRNGMLAFDDSSKLSPYLANGCLSPRTIYFKIKEYEQKRFKNASTYWLFFELLWRDYFALVHLKYKNRLFHPGGLFKTPIRWSVDATAIDAFIHGQTGYPLVDANMIELKKTGFMSNRGRQNVASFFTKNLGLHWLIGAEWFESCLIDYDVSSNYGNWAYVAGMGNDARKFRVFNVTKQGKDYDPNGEYAKRWLPAIQHISGKLIYDIPHFTQMEQMCYNLIHGKDFPAPIVDLLASSRVQREKFEKAYKGGKA